MKIAHYKRTNLALAPDEIVRATNEFTVHKAVLNPPPDYKADIWHFHNRIHPKLKYAPNQLLQYHSKPGICDKLFPGCKISIAQYPALYPEYNLSGIVRNIIPIHDPMFKPSYVELPYIKVGYSPSNILQTRGESDDKGYHETINILSKLVKTYPNKFTFDPIIEVSYDECIRRKNQCNVIIDECITGSYHKCTLEGLALGKLTICSLSKEIEKLLFPYCMAAHPIQNIGIMDLEDFLSGCIKFGPSWLIPRGKKSREWMEKYWRPQDIIRDYISIYEDILNA